MRPAPKIEPLPEPKTAVDYSKVASAFKKKKTGALIGDMGGTILTSGLGAESGKKSLLGS